MPANFFRFTRLMIVFSVSILTLMSTNIARAEAQAAANTFIVIGSEVIHSGNVPLARDKAIAESLVAAVALMTEKILEVDILAQNFQQLNELVYNQPNKFIEGYKVLTEATAGKYYRVLVEATVSAKKIAKELTKSGILRVKTDMPTVLLLIAEHNIDDLAPRLWWSRQEKNFESISQRSLAELLQEKGFSVIDPQSSRRKTSVEWGAFDKAELTDEEARDLGSQLGAQVIILGNSIASPTPNTMGTDMKSFKGTVTARALRADSGEEIATLSRTTVAANTDEITGGNEALSGAGTLAGESLAESIADVWQKKAQQPNLVEIAIEGTKKLTNFVRFRRILSSIAGVQGIRVKEMKSNEATLFVDYKGTAEDLASALMLKSFEGFGINITEVDQNKMRIALIPG